MTLPTYDQFPELPQGYVFQVKTEDESSSHLVLYRLSVHELAGGIPSSSHRLLRRWLQEHELLDAATELAAEVNELRIKRDAGYAALDLSGALINRAKSALDGA